MIVNSPSWDLQEKVAVSYELKNVNKNIPSYDWQYNAEACSSLFHFTPFIYIVILSIRGRKKKGNKKKTCKVNVN